jgi:hypothetical protein
MKFLKQTSSASGSMRAAGLLAEPDRDLPHDTVVQDTVELDEVGDVHGYVTLIDGNTAMTSATSPMMCARTNGAG